MLVFRVGVLSLSLVLVFRVGVWSVALVVWSRCIADRQRGRRLHVFRAQRRGAPLQLLLATS